MKKITPQEIEADMVLAEDVIGPTGGVIMQAGMKLAPNLGRRLKNWDVSYIYIEGNNSEEETDTGEDISREDIEAELEKRFSHCLDNPHMKDLFDAIVEFRMNS